MRAATLLRVYMRSLDGGPIPATGKSTFSARPPVSPVAALHARTDAMPRYRHDGSGRDGYLVSATAATGGAFAARAPASPKKKGSLRTDMLPPFTPSGSGRDTFHRVEYRGAGAAWRLRDYCRADAMDDLFAASRGRNDARPCVALERDATSGRRPSAERSAERERRQSTAAPRGAATHSAAHAASAAACGRSVRRSSRSGGSATRPCGSRRRAPRRPPRRRAFRPASCFWTRAKSWPGAPTAASRRRRRSGASRAKTETCASARRSAWRESVLLSKAR
mmetsp:Transcript_25238/g.87157  ORF Transcript_25238/g.87157 Transcript_25238/m.87157 type:complete len:279 (+) Transcript_25238:434-1270(+)